MPNTFAYFALFIWPIVVLALFRKMPISLALSWAIVAGYLMLPLRAGFDLPMFPTVDKNFVLSVSAAVMCLVALRWSRDRQRVAEHRRAGAGKRFGDADPAASSFVVRRGQWVLRLLLVLLFSTPFLTVAQNGDTLIIGPTVLPGLRSYDALAVNGGLVVALIPFLLGRRFLADEDGQKNLLKVLAIAAAAYSVFVLYEVRMSPQLNRMIYGFFPHSFAQHIRGDGFRPLVFLHHGLWLAIFLCLSVLSAFAIWRGAKRGKDRPRWLFTGIWLIVILLLCKSMGSILLTLLFLPVILFARAKPQVLIAALFAGTVLVFPAMRSSGWIPTETIHSLAASVNEDRAGSLMVRLKNEDILLAKAGERPLAGWGGWGRARVYNERGSDISITDGFWVIVIGTYGWLGYVAQFGLLCLPLVFLGLRRNRLEISLTSASVGILLAISLIDQIPNASIGPVVWLLAGSVMGRYQTAEAVARKTPERGHSPVGEPQPVASPAASTGRDPDKPRHKRRPRQPA